MNEARGPPAPLCLGFSLPVLPGSSDCRVMCVSAVTAKSANGSKTAVLHLQCEERSVMLLAVAPDSNTCLPEHLPARRQVPQTQERQHTTLAALAPTALALHSTAQPCASHVQMHCSSNQRSNAACSQLPPHPTPTHPPRLYWGNICNMHVLQLQHPKVKPHPQTQTCEPHMCYSCSTL